MTIRSITISLFVCLTAVALMTGCGGGGEANSANSPNSNKPANSNSTANKAPEAANSASVPVSTAPPLVTTIDDLQLSSAFEDAAETKGRMMKLTGNIAIANDKSLTISHGNSDMLSGNTVTCKGDFSKYSGLEDKIKGLAKENKAPKVVVEGKISDRVNYDLILEPCSMTEVPK